MVQRNYVYTDEFVQDEIGRGCETDDDENASNYLSIIRAILSIRNQLQIYVEKEERRQSGKRRREIATIIGLFVAALLVTTHP